MVFYAFTDEKIKIEIFQKEIISFISVLENNVELDSSEHPFDKNITVLSFLKNGVYFMGTNINIKTETNTGNIDQEFFDKTIKNKFDHIDVNFQKEKILNAKDCIYFHFPIDNIKKIRQDYENIIISIVDFFKEEYNSIVVQKIEKKHSKDELIIW